MIASLKPHFTAGKRNRACPPRSTCLIATGIEVLQEERVTPLDLLVRHEGKKALGL